MNCYRGGHLRIKGYDTEHQIIGTFILVYYIYIYKLNVNGNKKSIHPASLFNCSKYLMHANSIYRSLLYIYILSVLYSQSKACIWIKKHHNNIQIYSLPLYYTLCSPYLSICEYVLLVLVQSTYLFIASPESFINIASTKFK